MVWGFGAFDRGPVGADPLEALVVEADESRIAGEGEPSEPAAGLIGEGEDRGGFGLETEVGGEAPAEEGEVVRGGGADAGWGAWSGDGPVDGFGLAEDATEEVEGIEQSGTESAEVTRATGSEEGGLDRAEGREGIAERGPEWGAAEERGDHREGLVCGLAEERAHAA